MSTLTVPVPTGEFRRRSLSGDRDINFKRKKTTISLDQSAIIHRLISRLHLGKVIFVLLGSLMVCMYLFVYLNVTFRYTTTGEGERSDDFDVCTMTAKSANIYTDLKQTAISGRLRALAYHNSNEYLWKEHLLHSFNITKKYNNPFKNTSYPTEGDMRVILKEHMEGKTTAKEIINEYPFSFIVTPSGQCDVIGNSEGSVYLLFIIKSSMLHFRKRNVIRNTWANSTYTNGYIVRRIFIVGQLNDGEPVPLELKSEAALYGDILLMNFVDSHRNSTWKTRGGLKWASENCSNAEYVMLVDDNYYVSTDLVIQMLEFSGKPHNLYMGLVNLRPTPFRSKTNKWYVSKEEYPYPYYPVFVSASALLMSMDFVIDINIASKYTKHFMFDDVFLGIVAFKLHISPISNNLFYSGNIPYTNTLFATTLACYGYDTPSGLYKAWMIHMLIRCYGHNAVNHFLMKTGNRRSSLPIHL